MATISSLFGDWTRLEQFLRVAPTKIKAAGEIGSNRAGALLAKRIKEGLRNQAPGGKRFEKLSSLTTSRKSGTKALIASGELLRSVTWKKIKGGAWVGSNRRDSSGKYNLATIHEQGCTIKVTEKMRWKFITIAGHPLKETTKYIHIPARPFIGPVANDSDVQQEIKDEYIKAVQEVLRL